MQFKRKTNRIDSIFFSSCGKNSISRVKENKHWKDEKAVCSISNWYTDKNFQLDGYFIVQSLLSKTYTHHHIKICLYFIRPCCKFVSLYWQQTTKIQFETVNILEHSIKHLQFRHEPLRILTDIKYLQHKR